MDMGGAPGRRRRTRSASYPFAAYREGLFVVAMKDGLIAALRERADAGMAALEIVHWLRGRARPALSNFALIVLLHHAFDIQLHTLRPLEEWSGWNPGGTLTDAEAESLMSPLRSRPADFDRFTLLHRRPFAPRVLERPFELIGYTASPAQVLLRSRIGDDVLDVTVTAVWAMHLHTSYDRLEIAEATGDDLRALLDFAGVEEPYDVYHRYLRFGDGFVIGGPVGFLHNGDAGRRSTGFDVADRPLPPADPGVRPPLRFDRRFAAVRCTKDDHDLVLRGAGEPVELVFRGAREFKLAHFFDPLTVTDAGEGRGYRRFTLTDGVREGHVVCAGLEVRRAADPRPQPASSVRRSWAPSARVDS
jgi:hypothetical protein